MKPDREDEDTKGFTNRLSRKRMTESTKEKKCRRDENKKEKYPSQIGKSDSFTWSKIWKKKANGNMFYCAQSNVARNMLFCLLL